jgi:fluoride exporter
VSTVRGDELAVVAVGGVLGALSRAWISVALPHPDPVAWPWATFVTNLVGCLALGVVLDWIDSRHGRWLVAHPRRARLARPMLASGVLGGFTTFSTFSVEAVGMARWGNATGALGYAVSSVVLGVALVALGRVLGSTVFGSAPYDLEEDEEL